ncbi:flagellar hook-associated protein FlgL [Marinomonas communis]|uniref:Flagellar hook-associated protein 3 FlgL n=1 Tax=Marinomonas communis TaxID=28254 RepID=A0A4R6X8V8_9GAMM|nr:flagellar hook-associated protein FlgL [Marinomonas communis]TDR13213.1 flagellar hook-associated protein 3 FlgL [Marinomonas communis]
MRVTTNLIFNQSSLSMQKANERYLKVQEKISEQSDIVRPSDDPNGAGQLLRYGADAKLLDQYDQNMTLATNSLEYESVTLESLNSTLDDINVRLIQTVNGANSQDDLDTLAGEMESLLASVADLMNSKNSNGQYIFSGTSTDSPAFIKDATGKYVYAGNEAQQMSQIGDTVSIATNDSGKAVFQDAWTRNTVTATSSAGTATLSYSISDQDAYDTFVENNYSAVNSVLNDFTLTTTAGAPDQFAITDSSGAVLASGDYVSGEAITFNGMEFTLDGAAGSTVNITLDQPTRDNVLNQVMDAINALRDPSLTSEEREYFRLNATASIVNTQTNIAKASSSVGARLNTIDNRTDYGAAKQIFNQQAQENIGGLDIYKATTELELSESALSATQLLFQRISSLSLFNSI